MDYRVLADVVVLVHFGFIGFAVLGGFLVVRWRPWAWLHIPAFLWAGLVECAGWVCPLTPLENRLRIKAGGSGYREGFVEHYLVPLLYPEELTRKVQLILGLSVLIINIAIYAWVFSRFYWTEIRPARGVQ